MTDLIHTFAGRYAAYILPAWGLSILALVWMTASALLSARHWRKAAQAREAAGADGVDQP